MKNSKYYLQVQLADNILAGLSGLQAKYAKKLRKPLANTVRKLSRKYSRLLAKEHKTAYRKAAHEAAKLLIARTYLSLSAQQAARPAEPSAG